jgi:transcriptional regulator with XRE-family HTH domain
VNVDRLLMPRKKKSESKTLPFGRILKGIMNERDLTLKQVSELSNVSVSVVQGWLTNSTPADLQAVAVLASKLGISFKSLLLGHDEDISKAASIHELFDEQDFFDGYCKIKIQRLVPIKRSGKY